MLNRLLLSPLGSPNSLHKFISKGHLCEPALNHYYIGAIFGRSDCRRSLHKLKVAKLCPFLNIFGKKIASFQQKIQVFFPFLSSSTSQITTVQHNNGQMRDLVLWVIASLIRAAESSSTASALLCQTSLYFGKFCYILSQVFTKMAPFLALKLAIFS